MRTRSRSLATALGLALAMTACSTDPNGGPPATSPPPPPPPPAQPSPAQPTPAEDISLEVLAPTTGDVLSVPFEVTVEVSVPIGPPESEDHHVHVWFGIAQDDPIFLFETTMAVTEAPEGDQTMWVQVHTAEHEPVGEEVAVELTIEGGSGAGADDDDGGYDY